MLPRTFNETLERQYLYTSGAFLGNLKELSDADALIQPGTGGNCLNWVAGHVILHRVITMQLLGAQPAFAKEKYGRYNRLSEPITGAEEGVVPLGEMVQDWVGLRKDFFEAVRGATEVAMNQPAPFSPMNDPEETIGSLVAGLLFHESYHIGQLGILRRLIGKEGAIQ